MNVAVRVLKTPEDCDAELVPLVPRIHAAEAAGDLALLGELSRKRDWLLDQRFTLAAERAGAGDG